MFITKLTMDVSNKKLFINHESMNHESMKITMSISKEFLRDINPSLDEQSL